MIIKAYAKVNLILNVLGKRADGYHEIESVMQALPELYDEVSVEKIDGEGNDISRLPFGEKDLAAKALVLMQENFGKHGAYTISIKKNIPIAGGLGGGSTDGAAVMTAFCKMNDIPIDEKVYELAGKLGADVPFCLAAINGQKACVCKGIGEKLEPIEYTDVKIRIITSDIEIENKTKKIYQEFDNTIPDKKYDINAFVNAKNIDEKIGLMGNQLQPALERITGIKRSEILCGAGPSYFTIEKIGKEKS